MMEEDAVALEKAEVPPLSVVSASPPSAVPVDPSQARKVMALAMVPFESGLGTKRIRVSASAARSRGVGGDGAERQPSGSVSGELPCAAGGDRGRDGHTSGGAVGVGDKAFDKGRDACAGLRRIVLVDRVEVACADERGSSVAGDQDEGAGVVRAASRASGDWGASVARDSAKRVSGRRELLSRLQGLDDKAFHPLQN